MLPPTAPIANFVASARAGDLLHISGQVAIAGGKATWPGRLGATMTVEEGYAAARETALYVIGHIAAAVDDDLARVKRIVKLRIYIASTPEFASHPQVANGASDLLVAVFGDAGKHARAAIGVASLPLGAAVEIEAVVQLLA
jgi:enamine deaminase RidA (YjgF/YER057c/UK114 family)